MRTKKYILCLVIMLHFMTTTAEHGDMTTTPNAVSCTNETVVKPPGLRCQASCELGSCWKKMNFSENASHINCSWSFNKTVYNYNISIRYGESFEKNCGKYIVSIKEDIYTATFYLKNCPEIKINRLIFVLLTLKRDDKSVCEQETEEFEICKYVMPNPPYIYNEYVKDQAIYINGKEPSCPRHGYDWVLSYRILDGVSTTKKTDKKNWLKKLFMTHEEARKYKYTVRGRVIGSKYFSKAVHKTYVTKPENAASEKTLTCSSTEEKNSWEARIEWKNTGYIDYFNVQLFEDNEAKKRSKLRRKRNQFLFWNLFKSLDINKKYKVEITAVNSAGNSAPLVIKFDKDCLKPVDIDCEVAQKGNNWAEIKWKIDAAEEHTYKVEYHMDHTKNSLGKVNLNKDTRKWNLTNLQGECSKYKIQVGAVRNNVTQTLCHLTTTMNSNAKVPKFTICNITTHSFLVNIIKNKTDSCDPFTEYVVTYRHGNDKKGKATRCSDCTEEQNPHKHGYEMTDCRMSGVDNKNLHTFRCQDLHPDTEYIVDVSASIKKGKAAKSHQDVRTEASKATWCSDCTEEQKPYKHATSRQLLLIILCAVCGAMLIIVIITGIFYRLSKRGPRPMKPAMHPAVFDELKKDLLEDNRECRRVFL